jgi:transposase-like protein
MKKKLTKEEKLAKQELRGKLRELLGDGNDLKSINDLIVELKKEAIEMMYDEELKHHLGFSKNDERPEESDNYRNGTYGKKVKSNSGEIALSVPRDRKGEFEPQIVKKYQGDIFGIEDKII